MAALLKGGPRGAGGRNLDSNVASMCPQSYSVAFFLALACTFGTDVFSSCMTPFWFPILCVRPISVGSSEIARKSKQEMKTSHCVIGGRVRISVTIKTYWTQR